MNKLRRLGSKTGKPPKSKDELDEEGVKRYRELMDDPYHTGKILAWLQVIYSSPCNNEEE